MSYSIVGFFNQVWSLSILIHPTNTSCISVCTKHQWMNKDWCHLTYQCSICAIVRSTGKCGKPECLCVVTETLIPWVGKTLHLGDYTFAKVSMCAAHLKVNCKICVHLIQMFNRGIGMCENCQTPYNSFLNPKVFCTCTAMSIKLGQVDGCCDICDAPLRLKDVCPHPSSGVSWDGHYYESCQFCKRMLHALPCDCWSTECCPRCFLCEMVEP